VRYNEATKETGVQSQKSLYGELPTQFDRNDLYLACVRKGVKTKVKMIVYNWKKEGAIKDVKKDVWEKIYNEKKEDK